MGQPVGRKIVDNIQDEQGPLPLRYKPILPLCSGHQHISVALLCAQLLWSYRLLRPFLQRGQCCAVLIRESATILVIAVLMVAEGYHNSTGNTPAILAMVQSGPIGLAARCGPPKESMLPVDVRIGNCAPDSLSGKINRRGFRWPILLKNVGRNRWP